MTQIILTQNTLVAAATAVTFVGLLAWRVSPAAFAALRWQAVAAGSALFWAGLAALLIAFTWSSYYSHFVPAWYRYAAPIGALALYAVLGLGLRWLALRLPGNPVLLFCLLGGLEALPEHAVGIYRFHILTIPILQGSTAVAIFVFAYFEYIVYWALALALAVLLNRLAPAPTEPSPSDGREHDHALPGSPA